VNPTANKVFQEVTSNATPDSPRPPWPIPLEGASAEVARWWHGPTEKRNAWYVIYRIRVFRDAEAERATFSHKPVYRLRADSVEENFFTKAVRFRYFCHDEKWIELCSGVSRKPPAVLFSEWEAMIEHVRAIAAREEQRYEIAAARSW
jgi:hypothetical protein